jgi:large subunit GTPase 1
MTETGLEESREEINEVFPIPRKPAWTNKMTKQEVETNEKNAFLQWRRDLSKLEEKGTYLMTPYEKNINIWRQLWRSIERSDVCIQIVDARNPLLFRCKDLEKYVKEVDPKKENIILVNKSDLLTKKQRFKWAAYFKNEGIKSLFFSAVFEQEKIEQEPEPQDPNEEGGESEPQEKIPKEEEPIEEEEEEELVVDPSEKDWTHIFSREELLIFLENFSQDMTPNEQNKKKIKTKNEKNKKILKDTENIEIKPRITIGMIGYPNVGKSSVINVLIGVKKVNVGSTPGKTKHLQTMPLDHNILLCDCPGLVFPSVTTTKSEMVVDGILPIDEMRDFRSPMSLVVSRIPKRTFELTYGLKFNPKTKLTADYVLDAFAISKSIMSQNGVPNASRVARIMLKDYVSGKLLYCHPPPKMKPKEGSELVDVEYISEGEEEGENEDDDDDEYFTDDDDEKDDEENDHDFNEENVNEVRLKEKEKKTKTNEILSNILDVKVKDVEEATYVVEEKNLKHSKVKDSSKKYRMQEHKKKSIYSPIPVAELRKISKK